MTRTELTRRGDSYDLTCDELLLCWTFTDSWTAMLAQFELLKLLSWWHEGGGKQAIASSDFEQLVKFVMRAYEQPLTGEIFHTLQQAAGEPKREMFPEVIIDELPRWKPEVIEGGGS